MRKAHRADRAGHRAVAPDDLPGPAAIDGGKSIAAESGKEHLHFTLEWIMIPFEV